MSENTVQPKLFSVIQNDTSEIIQPKLFSIIQNDTSDIIQPKLFSVVQNKASTTIQPLLFVVIENPEKPLAHSDLQVELDVGDGTGYSTTIKPFITYEFNSRVRVEPKPFITYIEPHELTVIEKPYITYIDYDFDNRTKKKIYYFMIYNTYMNKVVKCRMYDTTEGFPLKDIHLGAVCDDNQVRYVALDRINRDFDSGAKVQDEYGNIFQICVGRQENIINRYFPYGNLLIPLTTYDDLYATLRGIFGYAHVEMGKNKDCVYFSPPSFSSGITKMFVMGLDVRITNKYNYQLTTYNNGLNNTSFGGDFHGVADAMLIKMVSQEKFKIEFNNEYRGTQYPTDALVKNALVIGYSVEALEETTSSYETLTRSRKWFLFDVPRNYILVTDYTNKYVNYFKNNYLKYTNSKYRYNYFDLQKMKYEFDKFGKLK